MATKLDKPVTRELQLRQKMRPVLVTLIPGDRATMAIEAIEFRLKGTQQSLRMPMDAVYRYAVNRAVAGARD